MAEFCGLKQIFHTKNSLYKGQSGSTGQRSPRQSWAQSSSHHPWWGHEQLYQSDPMNPMTLFDLITYRKRRENPPNIWWNHFFFVLLLQKQIEKGKTIMQSTANIENISISIPITDLSFLRTLSKKMGWTIKRQRKSGIDRALDDIKAGRVYEARSVDDLFEQLEKWNTGSNTPAHSKSHINYVSVEATIWLNWRKPSQFLNVKASCPSYTDLIFFPADMKENGSVTLNPTGFLFGFRKTTRWHFSSLIQELIQTYFENHRITWTGSSPRKSEPMYLSLCPRELLTIVESHILRVSEIQLRYKSPSFSQFSSNRQSLKMTSYCQPDLANGRMV